MSHKVRKKHNELKQLYKSIEYDKINKDENKKIMLYKELDAIKLNDNKH